MTTNTALRQDWTTSPERGNLLMLRFMSWISLRLGRQVARGLLHLIAAYFLLFSPASRRASRAYLCRALAYQGRAPNWRDLYRHFFTFAATVHDRIYLANDRFDLFDLTLHGYDDLERVFGRGQGLFLMGAHLGSFDVVRTTGRHHARMAVTMVMREGNAKMINAVLTAINPRLAQDIIALGHVDSMLKVSERLANGGAIGILADRTPGDEPQQRVTLLGDNAYLPVGPFRMAAMLQRPVYFMAGLYLGGNHYAVHFDPIADFATVTRDQREAAIEAAITRYAALLEQYCREAPYNWFNFFDFWQRPPAAITSRPS
jgi:predicted LPLAT superfamily acyltransferase